MSGRKAREIRMRARDWQESRIAFKENVYNQTSNRLTKKQDRRTVLRPVNHAFYNWLKDRYTKGLISLT